jgi:PAS domain S-box-containing protein
LGSWIASWKDFDGGWRSIKVGGPLEIGSHELNAILENAPVGIALLGIDRTVRYCNSAFLEIYGWEHEEMIGSQLPIPKHQQEKWEALLQGLRTGKKFLNVETVRVRKDGSEFYAKISGAPVFDRAGSLDAVIGFVTSTEDNHSEQLELRNLEHLVQAASDFMCVVDLELQTLFVNDPGRRIVGLGSEQDIDGTIIFDLFSDDSRERIANAVHSLSSAGVSIAARLHLKHFVTGASIPVSCSIFPIRDPHRGDPVCFDFVAYNLEVQQEAEQFEQTQSAFSALFHTVPVGVALVNRAGNVIDCNGAFQRLLGYSVAELTEMHFERFIHPEDVSAARALFLDLVNGNIERSESYQRLIDKDGNVLHAKKMVSLVRGNDGAPKHIVCVVELVPGSPFGGGQQAPVGDPGSSHHGTAFGSRTMGRIRGPMIGSRRWLEARSR